MFREMALTNAVFAAFASVLVLAMARKLTGSGRAAFVIAGAHAGSSAVLISTLNSEDIMPGYLAYLVSAAGLIW